MTRRRWFELWRVLVPALAGIAFMTGLINRWCFGAIMLSFAGLVAVELYRTDRRLRETIRRAEREAGE